MNRRGLVIVLAIAVAVGVVFGVHPQFDLKVAALFYNSDLKLFEVNAQPWVRHSRDAARLLVTLLVAPAGIALVARLIMPRRRVFMELRTALFLVMTLVIGPGLTTNALLKDYWGRARPIDVTEFGGTEHFTPWWDPRGDCPENCSFIAGEPSGAFWTLAPASLAPPQWRLVAYGGVFAFGAAVGLLRMSAGAHFFTDVVFAGVIMFLVVWVVHGLAYRWKAAHAMWLAIRDRLARIVRS